MSNSSFMSIQSYLSFYWHSNNWNSVRRKSCSWRKRSNRRRIRWLPRIEKSLRWRRSSSTRSVLSVKRWRKWPLYMTTRKGLMYLGTIHYIQYSWDHTYIINRYLCNTYFVFLFKRSISILKLLPRLVYNILYNIHSTNAFFYIPSFEFVLVIK